MRLRYVSAAVGLALWLVAITPSGQLEIDRSITAMFNDSDPILVDYRRLQASFGGNAIVMLVYRDAQFDSAAGFERNRKISNQVAKIDGVIEGGILSPAVLSSAVESMSPLGLFGATSETTPALIRADDQVAQGFDALFAGYTHSSDHQLAAVVTMLDPDHPPQTIDALKQLARDLPQQFDGAVSGVSLVGEPVLVHDGFELIERDGARLATLTVALLSLVVLVSLVDLRFALLMGVIIVWSVTLTRATMVWAGISLSLVSTILTAIVTVIAVAAVLHLGVRFRTARARGDSLRDATERTIARLILPIFWTCATDAAGFAALQASSILPVQQFGFMIALAAANVCVAVALFSPSIMMLPGLPIGDRFHRRQQQLASRLRRGCLHVARWFASRPWLGVAVAAVLICLSLAGTLSIDVETSFLNNFRATSPVVAAYDDVERNFGGAGVWDVLLDTPDSLTEPYLAQVRRLESDLRRINVDGQGLTKVLSLADAEQIAGQAPLLKIAPPVLRLSAMKLKLPVFYTALLRDPGDRSGQLRIMLRSKEQLPAELKLKLIEAVQQQVHDHTSTETWRTVTLGGQSGRVTGYYVMMARLVDSLVADQWRCLLVSGVLVGLLLVLATGSLRLAAAALLPNLLPVFLVLSALGMAGGKINMGAAMIAAVSIGLSIDGSVHFLASYQRHRRRQHPVVTAAVHAAGNVGVPVLLATLALVIGFSILASSEFIPTATFGVLVAATMAVGTLSNLTLLPACVVAVEQRWSGWNSAARD